MRTFVRTYPIHRNMNTQDTTTEEPGGNGNETAKPGWKRKLIWPGIALLVVIGMYAWRAISIKALTTAHQDRERQVVERSRIVIDSVQADAHLRDARLLGWAIRSEAMRNNMEQVEQYFMAYVREPSVQRVSLIGTDGVVNVSTDGKLIGRSMQVPPIAEGPTTELVEGRTMTYVPVLGVESLLGTILIEQRSAGGLELIGIAEEH